MRWQFRAFTDSDSPSTGRISWNVNYERNGLERNSYFSPEGTQLMAKFNIISVPTEALVAVMKVYLAPFFFIKLMYPIRHSHLFKKVFFVVPTK